MRAMRALLWITLAAQLVLMLFGGVSLWFPRHRVWPPPAGGGWRLYATWFLSWVSLTGVFLMAVLGENSLRFPVWLRIGAGVPFLVLGASLIAWAFRALSVDTTLGRGGPLVRSGPYRWSRNPQYVGACIYLAALVFLSGSHHVAIGCLVIAAWFLATPFVEEPWLAERYGDEYARYLREVPRFVGLRALPAAA